MLTAGGQELGGKAEGSLPASAGRRAEPPLQPRRYGRAEGGYAAHRRACSSSARPCGRQRLRFSPTQNQLRLRLPAHIVARVSKACRGRSWSRTYRGGSAADASSPPVRAGAAVPRAQGKPSCSGARPERSCERTDVGTGPLNRQHLCLASNKHLPLSSPPEQIALRPTCAGANVNELGFLRNTRQLVIKSAPNEAFGAAAQSDWTDHQVQCITHQSCAR